MMKKTKIALLQFFLITLLTTANENPISITIYPDTIHSIDRKIFGQFMEKASWGEPGPEHAFMPGTKKLQPEIVPMLRKMNIPIMRFPGGTDADWIDWRDLVDSIPGRSQRRPITIGNSGKPLNNNFGLHEYFAIRDSLTCQTILVVNFLDGLAKRIPLDSATALTAGLIAYTNKRIDDSLPSGMPHWPRIRAQNGHPEPFNIEFIQLGNELWFPKFYRAVEKGTGISDPDSMFNWYVTCFTEYINKIKSLDSSIKIITDFDMGPKVKNKIWTVPFFRENLSYACIHKYAPLHIKRMRIDNSSLKGHKLADRRFWEAWTCMPGFFDTSGLDLGLGTKINKPKEMGLKIACTEWNWNGWGFGSIDPKPGILLDHAKAIGCASFLNGMIRTGNIVKIGTQSMLMGSNWNITAIRIDSSYTKKPYYLPQGMATSLYSNHSGKYLLKSVISPVPTFIDPGNPKGKVAYVDIVVTGSEKALFIHAVNRHFSRHFELKIDLKPFNKEIKDAQQYILAGNINLSKQKSKTDVSNFEQRSVNVETKKNFTVIVQARTANVIQLNL